jgi:hypothetical protein
MWGGCLAFGGFFGEAESELATTAREFRVSGRDCLPGYTAPILEATLRIAAILTLHPSSHPRNRCIRCCVHQKCPLGTCCLGLQ